MADPVFVDQLIQAYMDATVDLTAEPAVTADRAKIALLEAASTASPAPVPIEQALLTYLTS